MKKKLLFHLSGWLLSTIIVNHSFAQNPDFKVLSPITVSSASNIESTNAKVNKAFGQFFKNATNLVGEEKNKKYLVEFVEDDQQINQQRKSIWVVCLEDPKEYIYVRVENMELEETQRIQKD